MYRPPVDCKITPETEELAKEYNNRIANWIYKIYTTEESKEKRQNWITYQTEKLKSVKPTVPPTIQAAIQSLIRHMELKFRNPDGTNHDSKGRFTYNSIMFIEVMALKKLKFKRPRSDTNDEESKAKRISTA